MPYDDDLARGHDVRPVDIDHPLNVVPVAPDLAEAICGLSQTYPNLGPQAVLSEIRRQVPGVTLDEVRTVMAGEVSA